MEEAIRRRCSYSFDIFRRNRVDYVARIQSNPLCYNHLYGSFSCMQENWILLLAFIILAIFIAVTICVACWTLVCRKKWRNKNDKRSDYNANVLPTAIGGSSGYVDYDLERRDTQQQLNRSRRRSSPRTSTRRVSNGHGRNVESNTRIKHIDSDVDDNDDGVNMDQISASHTQASPPFKDYEPPRRFHFHQHRSQSPPVAATTTRHHYSISNKHRTRSPSATDYSPRPTSVVSVRQIEI